MQTTPSSCGPALAASSSWRTRGRLRLQTNLLTQRPESCRQQQVCDCPSLQTGVFSWCNHPGKERL
jgi:hypothetical protein